MRSQSLVINDALLLKKDTEFQKALNIEDFKCSVGWLNKFKKRHSIRCKTISGESASVIELVIENSLASILEIVRKYSPSYVFNVDETGIFC